jgi:hypothetical protein
MTLSTVPSAFFTGAAFSTQAALCGIKLRAGVDLRIGEPPFIQGRK